MTVDLSTLEFTNDMYSVYLYDGSELLINKIDEDLSLNKDSTPMSYINFERIVTDTDGNETHENISACVGMSNDWLSVATDYEEYLGQALTTDNMKYCTLEVKDSE